MNLQFPEQSFVILWVSWCKNKCFWKRFTCTFFLELTALTHLWFTFENKFGNTTSYLFDDLTQTARPKFLYQKKASETVRTGALAIRTDASKYVCTACAQDLFVRRQHNWDTLAGLGIFCPKIICVQKYFFFCLFVLTDNSSCRKTRQKPAL